MSERCGKQNQSNRRTFKQISNERTFFLRSKNKCMSSASHVKKQQQKTLTKYRQNVANIDY